MRWSPVVLVVPALAGCSLIYNPNNLPDPRMIDAAIADVNPAMPVVLDFAPESIDEGQGEGGSAPVLLVLHGQNFVNSNLHLTLTPPQGVTVQVETVGQPTVSSGGDFVAFQLVAHVDGNLTERVPLDVRVTQDVSLQYGGGTATSVPPAKQLALNGLPELTGTGLTKLTTTTPPQKYSRVMLESVTFNGTAPAIVQSVSSLQIKTSVVASAGVAGTMTAPAGPGGVSGGRTDGGGLGGGHAGAASTLGGGGGGGAGLANDGTAGQTITLGGGTGGAAGHHTGDDLIASLDANQPSAGGVGGAGVAGLLSGGVGGGGAGIVVLVAGGDFTVGAITADGGAGGSGSGSGGGGGGGAGGAVIVSSDAGSFSVGAISIKAGGSGSGNGAGGAGGPGSVGRARWDAIAGTAPVSPDRAAHRGPAFMVPTRVFRTQPQTLTLVGTRNDGFTLRVTDQSRVIHDGGHNSVGLDDTALLSPTLYPGYNRVCLTLDGGTQGNVESDKCIELAYLP